MSLQGSARARSGPGSAHARAGPGSGLALARLGYQNLSKKHPKWSELDLMPPFWAFPSAKFIAGGPGTSWDYSGPLKQP